MADPPHNRLESDRRAELAALWSQSQPIVEAFIRSLVFNKDDQDDLLQETVKQVAVSFDTYDPDRSFASWAIGIARFKVIEHRRKVKRDPMALDLEVIDYIAGPMVKIQPEVSQRMLALEKCLDQLSARHRMLVDLRYADSVDVKTIAKRIGAKPSAISVALHKIRSALADCIQDRVDIMRDGGRDAR